MASLIKTLAFDCADALRLAQLWAAALGSNLNEDSTAERAFVEAPGWGGPNIWFNAVPEPKTAKLESTSTCAHLRTCEPKFNG